MLSIPTSNPILLLSNPTGFVRLQTQPPLRMTQTIIDRARGILEDVRSVHRLKRKAFEREADKGLGLGFGLRINQLEFMTAPYHQFGAGFRADANPVHPVRRKD